MKLLERQPDAVRDAPPEPPVEAPPEDAPPEPELRTCKSCGATMEPGQDWCLACGTAAGRRGGRPGVRSMSAVLGLTGLLLAGAVAASYAALSEDQTIPPTQTAAQSQVAQAPPPAAPTPPVATTPTTVAPTTPGATTTTGKSTLPKVQVPSSTSSSAPTPAVTSTPSTPHVTPPPVTPAPTPPSSSSGSSGS